MSDPAQEQIRVADAAVKTETPLHYVIGKSSGPSDVGIIVTEKALQGHLNLRGDATNELFLKGTQSVLGVALPTLPGTYEANEDCCVYWLGPKEWLVIVTQDILADVERKLRTELQGHFAVVDVSGGQTRINISGEGVEAVLKKSSVYNFNAENFAPGRCVQTTFAKATALVSKKQDNSFDLVVRRSFADYVARWLLDAGQEFGCRIES